MKWAWRNENILKWKRYITTRNELQAWKCTCLWAMRSSNMFQTGMVVGLGWNVSPHMSRSSHTVSAYPQAAAQLNRWDIFSFHRQGGAFNQQQPHTESLESICIWICVGTYWHWASLTPWPFWYNELHINIAPCVASLNQNFIIPIDSVLLCSLYGCVAFWFC